MNLKNLLIMAAMSVMAFDLLHVLLMTMMIKTECFMMM